MNDAKHETVETEALSRLLESHSKLLIEVKRLRDINKDLLAALRDIAETWISPSENSDNSSHEMKRIAQAAIAKAEGRS